MATIVPTLSSGRLTGAGLEAAQAVYTGASLNAASPDFGADPYGLKDSTDAIQKAIDKAHELGGGSVFLPSGTYKVSYPFLKMKGKVRVHGAGEGTRVFATADTQVPEMTGVFHTGTYNTREQDPALVRFGVENLMILARNGSLAQHEEPIPNVCGIIWNTDLGTDSVEPDARPTLSNVEIWDMDMGAAILGRDDQEMVSVNLKIRQTLKAGIQIGKHPEHPEMKAGAPGGAGGADNKFIALNVGGANKETGGLHAGVEIYTSQVTFDTCKVWYSRRTLPWQDIYGRPTTPELTQEGALAGAYEEISGEEAWENPKNRDKLFAGAGWFIKGTKNKFIGCEAQDNGGHGWVIQWGKNTFSECSAESSSYTDTLGGAARTYEAADFYICNGASNSLMIGCTAESPRAKTSSARWGFFIESWFSNLRIEQAQAREHPKNQAGEPRAVRIGKDMREGCVIDVNNIYRSTLRRDNPAQAPKAGAEYTLDTGLQVQAVYFEGAPAKHPENIEWAKGAAPAEYPAMAWFVRTEQKMIGYVVGAPAAAAPTPQAAAPQRLELEGKTLKLTPDGGSVTIPETDLSSLISRADALARRVEALEARPQGGGGGGAAVLQDTGIRLLETISESGGLCDVLIRRVGSTVQVWMVTTNPERRHGSAGPQFTKPNVVLESKTLPKGFLPALGALPNYPDRGGGPRYSHDNRFAVSAIVTSNIGNGQPAQTGTLGFFAWFNNLVMRVERNTNRAMMGSLVWTTTDPWPTQLPGTAYEG